MEGWESEPPVGNLVKPSSHLIRSIDSNIQICNRKSSFRPQIFGVFQPKVPSFLSLEAILLLSPTCLLGELFPHPWCVGRGGQSRQPWGRRGSSTAGGSRGRACPSPFHRWGGCRSLSFVFLSSSSISHCLRSHQPSLSPASAPHPTAAERR